MITLFDLGAEFWRNYFGSRSAIDAYSLTYDRIEWYRGRCARFVVCCDSPRSIRKEKHPTYKEKRGPKPTDAVDALRSLQTRLCELGVPIAMVDGYEGDDVIATLTRQAWPEAVTIIGSEKDFFCLIDDDRVHLVGKNGPISSAQCFEKYGVPPSQMTEFLAMVGDVADDIKGCPNCGEDRAAKLLGRFGDIACIRRAALDGSLTKGLVSGCGVKTIDALKEWDPTQALELVRMNDQLPISLVQLIG